MQRSIGKEEFIERLHADLEQRKREQRSPKYTPEDVEYLGYWKQQRQKYERRKHLQKKRGFYEW